MRREIAVAFFLGFVLAVAVVKWGVYDDFFSFVGAHYRIFIAGGAVAAALGAVVAAHQLRRNARLASVNFVSEALNVFRADSDMQLMFYSIEYSRFAYIPRKFHESIQERQLDKLLGHFSTVALAWKGKVINPADLVIVRYYVLRITTNPEVRKYMDKFLRDWAEAANVGKHPYTVLRELRDFLEKNPLDGDK